MPCVFPLSCFRLIPGSTPQECMRRFEDLKQNTKSFPTKGNPSSLSAEGRSALTTTSGSGSNQLQSRSAESGDQSITKEIAESSVSSGLYEIPQIFY